MDKLWISCSQRRLPKPCRKSRASGARRFFAGCGADARGEQQPWLHCLCPPGRLRWAGAFGRVSALYPAGGGERQSIVRRAGDFSWAAARTPGASSSPGCTASAHPAGFDGRGLPKKGICILFTEKFSGSRPLPGRPSFWGNPHSGKRGDSPGAGSLHFSVPPLPPGEGLPTVLRSARFLPERFSAENIHRKSFAAHAPPGKDFHRRKHLYPRAVLACPAAEGKSSGNLRRASTGKFSCTQVIHIFSTGSVKKILPGFGAAFRRLP